MHILKDNIWFWNRIFGHVICLLCISDISWVTDKDFCIWCKETFKHWFLIGALSSYKSPIGCQVFSHDMRFVQDRIWASYSSPFAFNLMIIERKGRELIQSRFVFTHFLILQSPVILSPTLNIFLWQNSTSFLTRWLVNKC